MSAPFAGALEGAGLEVVVVVFDVVVVPPPPPPGVGTVTVGSVGVVTPGTVGVVMVRLTSRVFSPSGTSQRAFHAASARRRRRSKPFGPAIFMGAPAAPLGAPVSDTSELSAVAL